MEFGSVHLKAGTETPFYLKRKKATRLLLN